MKPIPLLGLNDPISSLSHLSMVLLCFVAAGFLLAKARRNKARMASIIIYSLCTLYLFSMSGVYHMLPLPSTGRYVLRILDHTAIFLMIAGTFTPIHVLLFRGLARWIILIPVWVISITGIVLTSVFFDDLSSLFVIGMFIFMGWIGIISYFMMAKVYKKTLPTKYLIGGGLAYTVGALIDAFKAPILFHGIFGHHELFHLLVIIGAAMHWYFIYQFADYPISSKLILKVTQYPDGQFKIKGKNERIFFWANSMDEIRSKIKKWANKNFHPSMRPRTIKLIHLKEEKL